MVKAFVCLGPIQNKTMHGFSKTYATKESYATKNENYNKNKWSLVLQLIS